jgi:serine/threonine-protein kinase SRPK3
MFDGSWSASVPYTPEAHLAQMEAILGRMPQSLLSKSSDRGRFFDGEGESNHAPQFPRVLGQVCANSCSLGKLLMPRTFPDMPLDTLCRNPGMSKSDKVQFLDMVNSMIRLEPEDRPDARSLLNSTWLSSIRSL